jgi:mannitol-1-phosphate/altronate dehydrogenase
MSNIESVKNGIEGLVMGELLWKEARRRGIDKKESVEEAVESRLESRLVRTMRRQASEMVQDVPEEELQAHYDANNERFENKTFEEAKARIRMRLLQEMKRNAEAEFISGLKEKYSIEINEENLLATTEPEEGEK